MMVGRIRVGVEIRRENLVNRENIFVNSFVSIGCLCWEANRKKQNQSNMFINAAYKSTYQYINT
jgi:hypothetical protein